VLEVASEVPDVLAANLRCLFCGINPGRRSAAAAAHFANPRNDFWRLLHQAGFTPRRLDPHEQFSLLALGYGITNAAQRTTPGSGDLRRGDFDRSRIEQIVARWNPRALAFVGKEAYRGLFGERAELGPQLRAIGPAGIFVCPSTSPANAAVPYTERLEWFKTLHAWLEPVRREAVRALLVDRCERLLLFRFEHPGGGEHWWATPGGGSEPGETPEQTLRRELAEECGLDEFEPGPVVWTREHTFPWGGRLLRQFERFHIVRVDTHELTPRVELRAEGIHGFRWWTLAELEASAERIAPAALGARLRRLLTQGPPAEPLDVSN
jgi:G:T/U-mismatch repair DNA glycosylase/8-oxo-dGTP pyrophosphatase MutT (NUDIX family)